MNTQPQQLPAGLIDNNVELFIHEDHLEALQNGKVFECVELGLYERAIIFNDMKNRPCAVAWHKTKGLTGFELQFEYLKCLCGGFDNTPDIDVENKCLTPEYWDCPKRPICSGSGIACILPEGPGGRLSHKEIETVKAIATGEPSKQAAERLGVRFHTIRSYLKSVHKKLDAHSRADVMNFAYKNNIIR